MHEKRKNNFESLILIECKVKPSTIIL